VTGMDQVYINTLYQVAIFFPSFPLKQKQPFYSYLSHLHQTIAFSEYRRASSLNISHLTCSTPLPTAVIYPSGSIEEIDALVHKSLSASIKSGLSTVSGPELRCALSLTPLYIFCRSNSSSSYSGTFPAISRRALLQTPGTTFYDGPRSIGNARMPSHSK
jgi:hypothetical protein